MNEFTAKKLGEVLAFATVGKETFEKGREAMSSVLGKEMVENYIMEYDKHSEEISKIAKNSKVEDIVTKKLKGTGKKLREMRDLYVGKEWDNSTELLEWSGFFEGAATVHWSLVKGAGQATNHDEITELSDKALVLHQGLLERATALLHEVGKKKSV